MTAFEAIFTILFSMIAGADLAIYFRAGGDASYLAAGAFELGLVVLQAIWIVVTVPSDRE
ncbi:MAG: hypothetical protein JWP57_4365 [Spirosoma sp.]|nr:hypothetical protein [Spirosoma sp.]